MITDYHLMTPITVKSPRRGIRTGRGSPPAGGGSWGAARAPAGRGTCCTPRRWRRGPAARCRRPRSPPGCTAQVRGQKLEVVRLCVTLLSLMLGRGRWPPTSGITSTTMFWRAAAARVTTAPWRPHTAHTAWSAITCTGRMPAAVPRR